MIGVMLAGGVSVPTPPNAMIIRGNERLSTVEIELP